MVSILPELLLLGLVIIILVVEPFIKNKVFNKAFLGYFSFGGLLVTLIAGMVFSRPVEVGMVFGGMLRSDYLGFVFRMVFIFAAAITSLFFMESKALSERAEAYVLLMVATIGMCLMASSADLVMLYLSIETTSIPLYILSGFLVDDKKSIESGFKYLLFGAMTSAILLYGLSLVYGIAGTTNIYDLGRIFTKFDTFTLGISFLILTGLAFKVSLFPFHFWAPDVYEGAPASIAGFLSTASKAAGFAVIIRMVTIAFPQISPNWSMILAVLAALTMTVGNLIALTQKNIKRLLAYSSIAHAGYAMMGVVAFSKLGTSSAIFYLIAYILTNLLAFGIVGVISHATGSDEVSAYNGLNRRNSSLALAVLVAFLSLSGMPPFGGFVAKFFVFAAAIQSGWIWLAIVGVINSIIGLYYYLNILKYVYLYRMENQDEEKQPIPLSRPIILGISVLAISVILVGTIFNPWFGIASKAALSLF